MLAPKARENCGLQTATSTMTNSPPAPPAADRGPRRGAQAPAQPVASSRKAPSYPFQSGGDLRLAGGFADRADHRHGGDRSKHGGASFANVFDGDSVDAGQHLVEGKRASIDLHLARELVDPRPGLLKRRHQRDLHLRFGAANFRFLEPVRGFRKAIERRSDHLGHIFVSRGCVETEQARVDEVPVESIDRVSKAPFFAHLLKEPRRHATAHGGGEDVGGVVIRRARRAPLEAHHDMRLLEPPLYLDLAAAISGARFGGSRRLGEGSEPRLGEIEDMIVFDRPGGSHDGGAGAVAATQIKIDPRPVERPDALPRAQDRPADRRGRPRGRREEIEHQVVRRIFDRPDFLDDNILLSFKLLRGECALGEKIANDVKHELRIARQNPGEITRPFNAGLCVKVAAYVFYRLGDFAGVSTARALERHMLDEMREPVLARPLVARSRLDEHADRRGLEMRRRLGYDGEPRWKARNLNAHAATRAV